MMEAEVVAMKILEELLENICLCEDHVSDENECQKEGRPHVDLFSLITTNDLCLAVNCYSLLPTGGQPVVLVCQLKCLDQKASGYCGHYALYFSSILSKLCQSRDCKEVHKSLLQLQDPFLFWRRYWVNVHDLSSQVSEESWWPWTPSHIYSGDMERSYLIHLLTSTLSNIDILVVHFAYGLLQDSGDHLCDIQERITLFLSSTSSNHLIFILGVTNHWVCLMAYKTKDTRIAVFYLDSNNEPVLFATHGDIKTLVEKREKKHIAKKGYGYSEWKRNILEQSLCDQRDIVNLLCDCIRGKNDLRNELLNTHWSRLLQSYKDHVTSVVDSSDLYVLMLVNWLESNYSAHVIGEHYIRMLRQVGPEFLTPNLMKDVATWVTECCEISLTNTGISQVDHFFRVMQHLQFVIGN